MKNRTVIFILTGLGILIIVVFAVFYFVLSQEKFSVPALETKPSTAASAAQNGEPQQNMLVTDDFSLMLPSGWMNTTPLPGVSAMAAATHEATTDPTAQKLNFKSYLAVSYDQLKGVTLGDYVQSVKGQLQAMDAQAIFPHEQDRAIGVRAAQVMESFMRLRGVDVAVLMVAVKGEGDDVWVMSFNTLGSEWDNYKPAFYQSADSFILKKS